MKDYSELVTYYCIIIGHVIIEHPTNNTLYIFHEWYFIYSSMKPLH